MVFDLFFQTEPNVGAHQHATNGQTSRLQSTSTFGILREIVQKRGFDALFAGKFRSKSAGLFLNLKRWTSEF